MPDPAPSEWMEVGRVAGAYGVLGWLRIQPYTMQPETVLDYQPWRVRLRSGAIETPTVLEAQIHGKGLIIRIAECGVREDVGRWTGGAIECPVTALPALAAGEYYWGELLGLTVETADGVVLGNVQRLLETGANDVLVVRADDRERLIPYIPTVVRQVDKNARRMIVDWDPDF